jgi:antitoxin CcdA
MMENLTTVAVSVNADLLAEAEGLDLSELLERALLRVLSTPTAERIRSERAKAWQKENAEAIRAWNEQLEKEGLWSDGLRQF